MLNLVLRFTTEIKKKLKSLEKKLNDFLRTPTYSFFTRLYEKLNVLFVIHTYVISSFGCVINYIFELYIINASSNHKKNVDSHF